MKERGDTGLSAQRGMRGMMEGCPDRIKRKGKVLAFSRKLHVVYFF